MCAGVPDSLPAQVDKRGFRFRLPSAQAIGPDDGTLLGPQGHSCPEERALPGLLVGQLTPVVLRGGPRLRVHFKAPHLARGVLDPAVGAAVADVDSFHGVVPSSAAGYPGHPPFLPKSKPTHMGLFLHGFPHPLCMGMHS